MSEELVYLGYSDDPRAVSGLGGNYESIQLFCDSDGKYFLETKGKYGCLETIEVSKERAKKIYSCIAESSDAGIEH